MKNSYPEYESKMQKAVAALSSELATLRAGRASAAVLNKVMVDYYGTPTPITQIASVSTPEPRLLIIAPWDASVLKAVEKAILSSDIGINPINDGKTIHLVFPPLTEERRRELAKQVRKYSEEAKVAIRNVRRDALENYKAMKKKSEITEDDLRVIEKDIQELVDKYSKEIEKVAEAKEKELMEV
jgi:ribosome recycling factor